MKVGDPRYVRYLRVGDPTCHENLIKLRACLHGAWGPQVGEVTRLPI